MHVTCSVFLFSIGDVCTEEVFLCLSQNILFFSAQLPPTLNKCPEISQSGGQSLSYLFHLNSVSSALPDRARSAISPSCWIDSFMSWKNVNAVLGVVVSHPAWRNDLEVRCSRQEGTGVAPVHRTSMSQKTLHSCANLQQMHLWEIMSPADTLDWFDASFLLCSAFVLPLLWLYTTRRMKQDTQDTMS